MGFFDLVVVLTFFAVASYCAGVFVLAAASGKARPGISEDRPFVSVIIAARNEIAHLPALLEGLRQQDYPPDRFEVIVADDRSTDGTGALLARDILARLGMGYEELARVLGAVGNHHEEGGNPVSEASAALILADKADVHRSRVRNPAFIKFDIHDRVNYAVRNSKLVVDREKRTITLQLRVDTGIAPVMEYFEIFMSRMVISRRAADYLHCRYALEINGSRMV